jgi:hypothetical protein
VSTQVQEQVSPSKKRRRGRETATDMVRSLGLVILVVVPVWFLAQAPSSDEAVLREVDPTGALEAFAADVPAAPVPGALPSGWRATSSTYSGGSSSVRVGWVTPQEQYAEFSASTAPRTGFLQDTVGEEAERLDPVVVDGVSWEQYRESDGSRSLSRSYGSATVVVGTRRATAELAELEVLLRSLGPR